MVNDSFIKLVLENSLKNHGGTFDLSTDREVNFTSGYFVSVESGEAWLDLDIRTIEDFIRYHDMEGYFLGVWGPRPWYLDRSIWVLDRDDAIRIGRKNNQLAFWDCANQREVGL